MLTKFKQLYREFPRTFWVLVIASFIDRVGATLIYPFFSLYITEKFGVGMTEAGLLLAIFSVAGLFGSMFGGALTDRMGRRALVLFGLIISALSSVSMGLVNEIGTFYMLAGLVGLLSDIASPAYQAMLADILTEEQRAQGFGLIRIAGNLAWIIGPTIGGFIALRSYLVLFIMDAVLSMITALIVYRMVPETKPADTMEKERETLLQTIMGYRQVAKDKIFLAFIVTSILMGTVYTQMYSTLSVYLRDVHGLPSQGYGSLLSINASVVVFLQFTIIRIVKDYPELLVMAAGSALYLFGFTAYGFVSTYPLFLIAMILITFGEMLVVPTSQALAANFAPMTMRGRYMAFYGLAWAIPTIVGPGIAGLVMDQYDPRWVWYASGILCAAATVGFLYLHFIARKRLLPETAEEELTAPIP
jgi:MFS family permease